MSEPPPAKRVKLVDAGSQDTELSAVEQKTPKADESGQLDDTTAVKRAKAEDDEAQKADDVTPAKRAKLEGDEGQGASDTATSRPAPPVNSGSAETPSAVPRKSVTISTEADAGIYAYVSADLPGFSGTIKHRMEDFLVHEVDLSGNIVHLKSKELPETPVEEEPSDAPPPPDTPSLDAFWDKLTELEGEEFVSKLKAMVETKNDPPVELVTSRVESKPDRTILHKAVKHHFKDFMATDTRDGACVVFRGARPEDKHGRFARKKRGNAPPPPVWKQTGDFCEFTMYKENKDSMEAIALIAKLIRSTTKTFTFAGTKDKRAITVQRVSAYRVPMGTLAGLNKTLRGIALGDWKYTSERLQLGDLSGNHFVITLRDVKATSEESIHKSLESLRDNGFINYYGMQRFGTRSVPTHAVGIEMLNGRFKEAVELIMAPKNEERTDFNDARLHWQEHKDANKALELFPRQCHAERSILTFFSKTGRQTDYYGALEAIARNMRLMYVHAYQSYVWNSMASERIKMYPLHPVVGDLVDTSGAAEAMSVDEDGDETAAKPDKNSAIILLEDEEQAKKYSMEDVVLPLPGYGVIYPKNDIGKKYVEVMAKDGLDPHNMQRKHKTSNLSGGYRKVISKPGNVQWKFYRYNNPHIPLSQTDLDRLRSASEPESIPDGEHLAVVLELTLGQSQYATMALREVMKMETTQAVHQQRANQSDLKRKAQSEASSESPVGKTQGLTVRVKEKADTVQK
ncbi:hypothetical protein HDV00_012022 [Rhizophlyctis rosea]|nr:hypothetical protein HDV00_012022 [Rhizophlyctis rosea]